MTLTLLATHTGEYRRVFLDARPQSDGTVLRDFVEYPVAAFIQVKAGEPLPRVQKLPMRIGVQSLTAEEDLRRRLQEKQCAIEQEIPKGRWFAARNRLVSEGFELC